MQSLLLSCDSVLLLGEANFSFSLSLKKMLPPSVSMVTTCYQTEDRIPTDDAGIQKNITHLQELGARVLFGVDATKLDRCSSLGGALYDAIVFTFPHVGGKGNIGRNRELLKQFFQCCSLKLSPGGQVLLTLCNGQGGTPADQPQRKWSDSWQAVAMANWGSFILTETVEFCAKDYGDYYCTGYRSQSKQFVTQNAITHVFERCKESLGLLQPFQTPKELTLSINQRSNIETMTAQCPSDLCRVIDRYLLAEPKHPVSLISTDLLRLVKECFTDTTVLQAEELPLVVPAGEVITTDQLSPSELYHVDPKRTNHVPQQDCSHCYNRCCVVPQGSLLGPTTEPHEKLPLTPGDVQGLPLCTCPPRTALGCVRPGMEMVGQSIKCSRSGHAVKQGGVSHLESGSKHSSTVSELLARDCHQSEDLEPNSAKGPGCPCLSQSVKSEFVLRPTLLSHIPDILQKNVSQPLIVCGRVFRRCGIDPKLYPIMHQCLMVTPMSNDSEESWEGFKERVSRVSAGLLERKGQISIEECHSNQDDPINHHSPLVFEMEEPSEHSQSTVTIGESGIFHSAEGDCHYCIWKLDTIAMVKYSVEDVRLFWSIDDRIFDEFSESAESNRVSQSLFKGYSIYPPVYAHDVSFWLNEDTFDELDFCSVIRSMTFDLVREVRFLNQYINRKISYTYRLVYQSCDCALTKEAATQLQLDVRRAINKWLGLEPR